MLSAKFFIQAKHKKNNKRVRCKQTLKNAYMFIAREEAENEMIFKKKYFFEINEKFYKFTTKIECAARKSAAIYGFNKRPNSWDLIEKSKCGKDCRGATEGSVAKQ